MRIIIVLCLLYLTAATPARACDGEEHGGAAHGGFGGFIPYGGDFIGGGLTLPEPLPGGILDRARAERERRLAVQPTLNVTVIQRPAPLPRRFFRSTCFRLWVEERRILGETCAENLSRAGAL